MKATIRAPTQDELLARALDTEEGNIIEHRDYLSLEEEKRRRARVVRAAVNGPVLRWVSRAETVEAAPQAREKPEPVREEAMQVDPRPPPSSRPALDSAFAAAYSSYLYAGAQEPIPTPIAGPSSAAPPPPSGDVHMERVARNYVVHELGQDEDLPLPRWEQTMRALFGDHVRWEDLKVYTGKSRPSCECISFSVCTKLMVVLSAADSVVPAHGPARKVPRSEDERAVRGRARVPHPDCGPGAPICLE